MPKPDDIDAEIESLLEKAKKQPDRYGSDLAAAYLQRDKLHKRQFEASLKRRAAALGEGWQVNAHESPTHTKRH